MFRATFSVGLLLASMVLIGKSILSTDSPAGGRAPTLVIPAASPTPEGPAAEETQRAVMHPETESSGTSPTGARLAPAITEIPCAADSLRLRLVAHQPVVTDREANGVRRLTPALTRLPEIDSPVDGPAVLKSGEGGGIPQLYRPAAAGGLIRELPQLDESAGDRSSTKVEPLVTPAEPYRLASQPPAPAALEQQTPESFRNDDPPPASGQDPAPVAPIQAAVEAPEPPREVQLSPHQAARRARLRQCLDFYYQRRALNSNDDGPWSMMHAMLGFGVDTQLHVGSSGSQRTSAIGWMTANRECRGERLLHVQNNAPYARRGPGLQGHDCQFLAMLAQCGVAADHPLRAGDRQFRVADLVEVEKAGCRSKAELTFQLISLSHYLPSQATWQTPDGQRWSISRLIREEMAQPINGVTCGGTHRLMALTMTVDRRRASGEPVDGDWARALRFTQGYQRLALQLQNRNGSLSCDFFRKRGEWGGVERQLKTTGHTLEWLVYSLPERQLQSNQMVRAVDFLTTLMTQNRYYDWEKGPMGHGIRALALYDQRVFGGQPGRRQQQLAGYRNRPLPPAKVARQPSKNSAGASSRSGSRSGSNQRSFGRLRRYGTR